MSNRLMRVAPLLLLVGASAAGAGFDRIVLAVEGSPRRLAAADVDSDGDIDLVVESVEGSSSHQFVLRNDGGQVFVRGWSATQASSGFPGVADLDLGDVDGDTDSDLVLQVPGQISVLRFNAGNGTFSAPVQLPVPNVSDQHALADLEGDGDLDLGYYLIDITGYAGRSEGNGFGAFSFGGDLPTVPVTDILRNMALGDVTGDGLQDFLLPSQVGLYALRGAPGTFAGWTSSPLLLAAGGHRDVASADLDGDGFRDVVATRPSGGVTVVPVHPTGAGTPAQYVAGLAPDALALADLNLDGHPDAAVTNARGGTVSLLLGNGTGGLVLDAAIKAGRALSDIVAADLDGDGDADLAVADARGDSVVLLFNLVVP